MPRLGERLSAGMKKAGSGAGRRSLCRAADWRARKPQHGRSRLSPLRGSYRQHDAALSGLRGRGDKASGVIGKVTPGQCLCLPGGEVKRVAGLGVAGPPPHWSRLPVAGKGQNHDAEPHPDTLPTARSTHAAGPLRPRAGLLQGMPPPGRRGSEEVAARAINAVPGIVKLGAVPLVETHRRERHQFCLFPVGHSERHIGLRDRRL
jgi:hypothetical protein